MSLFSAIDISVIVPFYNEAGNLEQLLSETRTSLCTISYELILIDDGSTDDGTGKIQNTLQANEKIIVLNKNYGQSAAIKAGVDIAQGNVIALLDGDLQSVPVDLVKMWNLLIQTGADVAQGKRIQRKDPISKRLPSYLANQIICSAFNFACTDVGCPVKVFRREVLRRMIYFQGFHRYFSLIAHIQACKVIEVDVTHRQRISGKSKYGMGRTFRVIRDLIKLKWAIQKMDTPLRYQVARKIKADRL